MCIIIIISCYHGNSELIMVPLNSELHKVKL